MPADDEAAAALRELSNVLLGDETLSETLHRVCVLAVRVLDGFDEAAVTLHDGGKRTAACTNTETLVIDEKQYAVDDGPCLEAIRTGRTIEVTVEEARERWPDFTAAAEALGVQHFAGVPLTAGDRTIGALNLYGHDAATARQYDERVLRLLQEQASVTLANAFRYDQARSLAGQLTEALASRAVIEQAKGVLMERQGLDADAAFDALRRESQRTNRKLRAVALGIVTEAITRRR